MEAAPNPYQAPKTDTALIAFGDAHAPEASEGQRFATYVIDSICMRVLSFAVLVSCTIAGLPEPSTLGFYALGVSIMIGFYAWFEFNFGRTPGKMLAKTRVVRVDGGRPTAKQVLLRTICRFIPFEPLSAFSGNGMWHDRISRTRVVSERG
jgi:uncharacterized RDD family membrane protein YckC